MPLTQPKELRMANLQFITTYVHSISSAKLAAVHGNDSESLATFLIIGTYEDKMRGLGKLFHESLNNKNEQLIAALPEYKDQLIFYNKSEQELIFSVDNMCLKIMKSCHLLLEHTSWAIKKQLLRKKSLFVDTFWNLILKEMGRKMIMVLYLKFDIKILATH